jgi:hypothetical protein
VKPVGGNSGVQEITGGKPTQVSNWRALASFPPKTYIVMTEALRDRGKAAPAALWRMQMTTEAAQ